VTSLPHHQSCVWIEYVGGNNHAAYLVSSSTALAFLTNMSKKRRSTSPSAIEVKIR
jgi:hypothetical protein